MSAKCRQTVEMVPMSRPRYPALTGRYPRRAGGARIHDLPTNSMGDFIIGDATALVAF